MHSQKRNQFAISKILAACLVLTLSACGGGGGGSAVDASSTGNGGGATTPPTNTPAPTAQSLQTHFSKCPTTLAINEQVACMGGLYEGKTTDTGAYCAFRYNSEGVASYTTAAQSESAGLGIYSGAVFEKKAGPSSSGFAINWSVGIASGHEMELWYQSSKEPASANGLLIKTKKVGMPACLVESGPTASATGDASTTNLLGKTWQSPQMLNGGGALGLFSDQPGFDAGLADDGRAVITLRQPDASGRMAVYVVEGKPGAASESAVWTAPVQLDAAAPLLAGNFRPRIAVSSSGHAVVSWLTEAPCDAQAYQAEPAGKTCRYLYASRRLATEASWEPALRVRASPPMKAQDHFARINARGDIVLAFPSFYSVTSTSFNPGTSSALAIRHVGETAYRTFLLSGFWSNYESTTPFGEQILSQLDDAANLFVAGKASWPFDLSQLRTTTLLAPEVLNGRNSPVTSTSGSNAYELRTGASGFAAYTWRDTDGSKESPAKLTVYSPTSQAWLAPYDIKPYTLWGNTNLVGTDNPDGEFLLYSACKLTAWKAGTWGTTRNLPAYCGRDQAGGVYAYNRKGDYLGINWASKPGQWGYYSYAQDKMLKGAPGNASAAAGDLVLGTAADLFAPASTQLLLSPSGLALAVTTNTFTTLPSAANPAGVTGGAAAKLWAVYLK
jgi:hypothetical protein